MASLFNPFGKKKEVPVEVKVRRFKYIMIGIAVAVVYIFVIPTGKKEEYTEEDLTKTVMDRSLDSLIRFVGFDEFKVYQVGELEEIELIPRCDINDTLVSARFEKEYLSYSKFGDSKEISMKIDSLASEVERLEKAMENFKENNPPTKGYSRRIRFESNGEKYTFLQQYFEQDKSMHVKYLRDVTGQAVENSMILQQAHREVNKDKNQ